MTTQPSQRCSSSESVLDDVDAFYLRLARALKAKFNEAPDGVTAAEIWDIVAKAGDAPLSAAPGRAGQ